MGDKVKVNSTISAIRSLNCFGNSQAIFNVINAVNIVLLSYCRHLNTSSSTRPDAKHFLSILFFFASIRRTNQF